jgi:hypothetical protein
MQVLTVQDKLTLLPPQLLTELEDLARDVQITGGRLSCYLYL